MNNKQLHMIGNAHLDLVWLWRWQEGMQEGKSTLRSALDRIGEFDDFIFTTSTAALFDWVEHNDPAMFEELRECVQQGRIQLVGGWWVEPDCNLPSGESFARQGLYGQRYFREKFGITARTAYNIDSFGHCGVLPQVFRKSGMNSYVMMRPMSHEKGLPAHLFQWEADDGSRVLCFRVLYEYLSWGKELDYHISRCAAEITEACPKIMCFYGVGNHGGGPTIQNIKSIGMAAAKESGCDILFSTPDAYFASVAEQKDSLPVIHGELLHHAAGCYSAMSECKRMNRQCENSLLMAEKLSAVAHAKTTLPYPDLGRAWKRTLFNQFHDTLAGTSLMAAYDDARNYAGAAIADADDALCHAVQSLSWQIDIPLDEAAQPVVVFNLVGAPMQTRIDFEMAAGAEQEFTVLDSHNQQVTCQKCASCVQVNGRQRVSFLADLPSLGYQCYRIYKKAPVTKARALTATDTMMENERFLLSFDPETGYIERLYDKRNAFEVFKGAAAVPLVINDDSDAWSHDITRFADVVGRFVGKSVRLIETGPVCATIRVISEYSGSRIVQDFTMHTDIDRIDVRVKVLWCERQKMLKLSFPVRSFFNKYCYETPFGYTERGNNGEEYPMHSWFDATGVLSDQGKVYGFAVLNDSKFSGSVDKSEMQLTLLRSPIFAHHQPVKLDDDAEYDVIDQGVQYIQYALYPHEGKWESSQLETYAQSLNQPPIVAPETFHAGLLPQCDSFASVNVANVRLSALKRAEDGDGFVVRLYESHKTPTEAVLSLPFCNREAVLKFGANEIKTLMVPDDTTQAIYEVNLIELKESDMA